MADKVKPPKRIKQESGPEIRIGPPAVVGRATMQDIDEELMQTPWPRAPLSTISFEGQGTDQRGVAKPKRGPVARIPITSAPEIEIRLTNAGRDTMSAIDEGELDDPPPRIEEVRSDALELRTFVVPTTSLAPRSSDDEKRAFVRERLGHRLPCPPSLVRRVDVKLLEPGAVIVRVWCPVD